MLANVNINQHIMAVIPINMHHTKLQSHSDLILTEYIYLSAYDVTRYINHVSHIHSASVQIHAYGWFSYSC